MSSRRGRRAMWKRRSTEAPPEETPLPRWEQWLTDQPPGFFLLAAIVTAGLIITFVLSLDETTVAVVSCVAFAGLLLWWTRSVWRGWRDAELTERFIGVAGFLLLLGTVAAKLAGLLVSHS